MFCESPMTNSPGWKTTPQNVPTGRARALVAQCSRAVVSQRCICFPGLLFQGSMPSIAAHATGYYRIIYIYVVGGTLRTAMGRYRAVMQTIKDGQLQRAGRHRRAPKHQIKTTPPQTTLDHAFELRHVSCVKDLAPRTILRTTWHGLRNWISKLWTSAWKDPSNF